MRKGLLIGGLVGAAAISTIVYGWGAGWYQDACNPVVTWWTDRTACTALARFENSSVQELAMHPDGSLVAVIAEAGFSSEGRVPTRPLEIVTLGVQDGTIRMRTAIKGLPPKSAATALSVNQKGTQFALGLLFAPTRVYDLRSGEQQRQISFASIAGADFTDDGALIIDRGHRDQDGLPRAGTVMAFDIASDPPRERPLQPGDTDELFLSGLDAVTSRDGRYLARNAPTPSSSDGVRIQISRIDSPGRVERTLTSRLSKRCSYPLTRMAFSPNGTRIAASFDCYYRWGETTQALIVWDLSSGQEIGFFPTHYGWRDILWLNNERLVASRYNVETRNGTIYRFDLNSGR